MESLEAGSDECLEDRGPGRLHLSYSTCLGGSWELQIPRGYDPGWARLKNLDLRGSETLEFEVWRSWGLEVTNASRIVALVFSISHILRVSEGPGSSRFREVCRPGGSA